MNTKVEVLRLLLDTSAAEHTTVTLHYASDEPAHPVWGGGVKQKQFPPTVPTSDIITQVFGDTGLAYIHWPDAAPAVAAWFLQQPGLSPYVGNEPERFDRTGPEDAALVAQARQLQAGAKMLDWHTCEVPVPLSDAGPDGPTAWVKFGRHDAAAPWVALSIRRPDSAAPGAEPVLPFTHPAATDAQH